jgi:hypothetical protein
MYMLGGKNEKYPVYSSIFLDASSILEASTRNKYWVKIQKSNTHKWFMDIFIDINTAKWQKLSN